MKTRHRSTVALAARKAAREGTLAALREGRKLRSATFRPKTYYTRNPKHRKAIND